MAGKGSKMTLINVEQTRRPARSRYATTYGRTGPAPARPATRPIAYTGTGVTTSRAPHRGRPVSAAVTVAVAAMAALVTVWLGEIAHLRTPSAVPDRLTVIQVQPGENLQQLATRVLPGAPVTRVAERIKELNDLDSATLDAGETLVVPAR